MTKITDGEHVTMTCENHPELSWHCKIVAVTKDGRYNSARNIFFVENGKDECSCPGSTLIIADDCRDLLEAYHNQD